MGVGILVKRTLLKPILIREPSAVFRYVPDMSPFHYAPFLALPFSASLFFNVEKIISSTYVCWQDKEDPYLPRYASKGFLVLLYDSIQSCDFGFCVSSVGMCERHFTLYQRKGWEHQETNYQIGIGYDTCRVFTPVNEVPEGKASDQTCGKAYDDA